MSILTTGKKDEVEESRTCLVLGRYVEVKKVTDLLKIP